MEGKATVKRFHTNEIMKQIKKMRAKWSTTYITTIYINFIKSFYHDLEAKMRGKLKAETQLNT